MPPGGPFANHALATSFPGLNEHVSYLFVLALAQSTRSSYATGWRTWMEFCKACAISAWVADEPTLCFFVAWLSLRAKVNSWATVHKYLYGVRSYFLDAGLPDPLKGKPLFDRVVQGVKKCFKKSMHRARKPITVALLLRLQPFFDFTNPDERTLYACMVICTFGLLRLGEATVKPNNPKFPTWMHVTIRPDTTVGLFLPVSKTDQLGRGHTVNFAPSGHEYLCPVKAFEVLHLLHPENLNTDAPLFPDAQGKPLTGDVVIARLKAALVDLNDPEYPASSVSGHSFRKGGAQSLFNAGFDFATIKLMGRWSSWCVELYTELSTSKLIQASRQMAAAAMSAIFPR